MCLLGFLMKTMNFLLCVSISTQYTDLEKFKNNTIKSFRNYRIIIIYVEKAKECVFDSLKIVIEVIKLKCTI